MIIKINGFCDFPIYWVHFGNFMVTLYVICTCKMNNYLKFKHVTTGKTCVAINILVFIPQI